MSPIDSKRLAALLTRHGLDGLLIVAPENFSYFVGVSPGPGMMWRRVGPSALLLGGDGRQTFIVPDAQEQAVAQAQPDARVLSLPLWIERLDVAFVPERSAQELVASATASRAITRPETYDAATFFALLHDAIVQQGLYGRRIGVELEYVPAVDLEPLRHALGESRLGDSSALIRELRLIKAPAEIALLRTATELAESGIRAALEGLRDSDTAGEIALRYEAGVLAAVGARHVGGYQGARSIVHLGPRLWGSGDAQRRAQPGDLLQFDSGVNLGGYASDIGRTFTLGPSSAVQRQIDEALRAGYRAGLAELRPGRRFADVFVATESAVRAAGFPSYTRGHFGHSIGSAGFAEEWPWISAQEQRVLEPGMVLAFEVPYYPNGIGGYQYEDNLLITADGHLSFNTLPLELSAVAVPGHPKLR